MFVTIDPRRLDQPPTREWGANVGKAIVGRRAQSFRYFESESPFEYDYIRLLYRKKRMLEIQK